jgi:hypothetical protein
MACACGKGRKSGGGSLPQYVYDYTADGSDAVRTFGTPLEAKRELRRNGGGVIRRREIKKAAVA